MSCCFQLSCFISQARLRRASRQSCLRGAPMSHRMTSSLSCAQVSQGTLCLRLRDELGITSTDEHFADMPRCAPPCSGSVSSRQELISWDSQYVERRNVY
jgi:hypothetical protein